MSTQQPLFDFGNNSSPTLESLEPSKQASYSPALYLWLRKHAHFKDNGSIQEEIYQLKTGSAVAQLFPPRALFIGTPAGHRDFTGAALSDILAHQDGPETPIIRYAQLLPHLVLLEDFWGSYRAIGRCAIDPGHLNPAWQDVRYHKVQGHTVCLWCKQPLP